jgi:hypothetical protein
MNNLFKIHGAVGNVYLKFNGNINELANLISKGLMLPDFYFDTEEDPPHEKYGMCEAMGFQVWLENSNLITNYNYKFKIETSDSFKEIFNDQIHDLSLWLARYISKIGVIRTLVEILKDDYVIFEEGKIIPPSSRPNE